jgi:hypothetical protein
LCWCKEKKEKEMKKFKEFLENFDVYLDKPKGWKKKKTSEEEDYTSLAADVEQEENANEVRK